MVVKGLYFQYKSPSGETALLFRTGGLESISLADYMATNRRMVKDDIDVLCLMPGRGEVDTGITKS